MPRAKLIDADTFECADCRKPHPVKELELSKTFDMVCTSCYLKNVPDEDIEAVFVDYILDIG